MALRSTTTERGGLAENPSLSKTSEAPDSQQARRCLLLEEERVAYFSLLTPSLDTSGPTGRETADSDTTYTSFPAFLALTSFTFLTCTLGSDCDVILSVAMCAPFFFFFKHALHRKWLKDPHAPSPLPAPFPVSFLPARAFRLRFCVYCARCCPGA